MAIFGDIPLDGQVALVEHTHEGGGDHNHDTMYAATTHNHDTAYSAAGHAHTHNHSAEYAALDHTHAGGAGPQTVVLTADRTAPSTANTLGDVTGLAFPVAAGTRYWFRFVIAYTAAATTTGSRWGVNGPAVTALFYRSEYSLTATSRTFNEGLTAYNLPAACNATSAATGGNVAVIEGIVQPSAAGSVIARFASEVANSAIVAKTGSFVEYRVL